MCGCQQLRGGYDMMSGNTPIKNARMMESENPDERWKGIEYLVNRGFGRKPPYTTRYGQIALQDEDPLVRAVALRALNRARDGSSGDVFIKALDDKSPWVRLEAAKALANLPDPDAVPALVKLLADSAQPEDIRIAAASAMRHYPTVEVARALVAQLPARNFGVAWQSRESLRQLTDQDFAYDEAAWLNHLTRPNPFG
jgi:HEAT repeat protein